MKKILIKSIGISILILFSPVFVFGQNVPFPDSSWEHILPQIIINDPEFSKYQDVYSGGDNYTKSPLYKAYNDQTLKIPNSIDELLSELARLKETLGHSNTFNKYNGPLIRSLITDELDGLISVWTPEILSPKGFKWEIQKKIVGLNTFQSSENTWEMSSIPASSTGKVKSTTIYLRGTPNQIVLSTTKENESNPLMPPEDFVYFANLSQAIEIKGIFERLTNIFSKEYVAQLKSTSKQLKDINLAWDNYLSKGYSQYPWESLINSHITDYSWSRPPEWQMVFFHPEVSMVLDIRDSKSSQIEPSLEIHTIGFISYFGNERKWFMGASGTVSMTGDEKFGMGIGPTLHLGYANFHEQLPHISLSVLWHDFEKGSNGPVIGLSIDFFRLLSKTGNSDLFWGNMGNP